MTKSDKKEIEACRYLIKRFKIGYGANCKTSDLDDFDRMYKKGKLSKSVIFSGRCASCRAKEAIIFLKEHIELLKI